MAQALIGVSLDNRAYSTEVLYSAMLSGLSRFSQIHFLIADRLQMYNRVATASTDPILLSAMNFASNSRVEFDERAAWLKKLKEKLPSEFGNQKWVILSIDDIADTRAFRTLRAVRMLYRVDAEFRADVDRAARQIVERRQLTYEQAFIWQGLSVDYIIEEVALNIRLRLGRRIHSEFYLGTTFYIFLRMYRGEYSKSVHDLFGRKQQDTQGYEFFDWDGFNWRRATADGSEPPVDLMRYALSSKKY
jgi:tRNA-dependent cyclodipeptide synthase